MRRLLAIGIAVSMTACSQPAGDSDWMEHRPMEVARSEHPAVVADGEIVVLGGLVETGPGRTGVTASVEAYDPETDSWRSLAELPSARHHIMAAVVDGRLYAIGGFSESGFDPVDTVWELVDEGWEDRSPLPGPRGAGAAVTLDGMVYLVGGVPDGGLLRYDPGSDRWQALTGPDVAREHVAAAVVDGEIWAIAGRWRGEMFASTEIYDPDTDQWSGGPTLIEARSGFGAVAVEGTIVVAGGEVFDPARSLPSVEFLDEGRWVEGEAIPFGLHGNPLVALDGRLYLPGGSTRAGGVDNPGRLFSYPVPEP